MSKHIGTAFIRFRGIDLAHIGSQQAAYYFQIARSVLPPEVLVKFEVQTLYPLFGKNWGNAFLRFDISPIFIFHEPHREPLCETCLHISDIDCFRANLRDSPDAEFSLSYTVDPQDPSTRVHELLTSLPCKQISYLPPTGNGARSSLVLPLCTFTPVADFLISIIREYGLEPLIQREILPIASMVRQVLGGRVGGDIWTGHKMIYFILDPDDSVSIGMEPTIGDACNCSIVSKTALEFRKTNRPSSLLLKDLDSFVWPQLPFECGQCLEIATCGGGSLMHRAMERSDLLAKSRWCTDILMLSNYLRECLAISPNETLIRRRALMEMANSESTRDRDLHPPFIASPYDVISKMLDLAEVNEGDVVYDLGSGDGRVIIHSALQYGARGIGIERDPELVKQSVAAAQNVGAGNRVSFIQGDIFDAELESATVVTLYLWAKVNKALRSKLLMELKPGVRIVSHGFPIDKWHPSSTIRISGRKIFLYKI